jgi:hypothetical protein
MSAKKPLKTQFPWLQATVVLLSSIVVLAVVQYATPGIAGRDGYYHLKLAELMRTQGLLLSFPWLPLSVLGPAEYVDHHFLFHVLLIPFTFGDLLVGAKVASVLFAAAVFGMLWWLLYSERVAYAWLWALGGLALSEAFLYRMSMPRAQSLSLAVLLLALHLLLRGKYRALFIVGWVYVWLYNAFPLLLVVAGAYSAALWIHTRKIEWRALAYAAGGVALGLVINPYFPRNLTFALRHILPKLGDATAISVGSEWYPYDTMQLLQNSWPTLLLLVGAIFALGWAGKRMSVQTTTSFLLALAFGLMLLQARRFIEYFPPMVLLFAAFSLSGLKIAAGRSKRERRLRQLAPYAAGLLLAGVSLFTIAAARGSMQTSEMSTRYAGAAAWLEQNTAQGSLVFQTDWDDFPELFFYNHHNIYLVGLDPTYMQLYDAELYDLWVALTNGDAGDLSATIVNSFGARVVFSDLGHQDFIAAAENDEQMREAYRDDYTVIYVIEE